MRQSTTCELPASSFRRCTIAWATTSFTSGPLHENAKVVLDHLAEFARSGGAVLLVTHDPQAAGRADRVLRLHEGRVEPQENGA